MPYFRHGELQLHYIDVDRRQNPSRGIPLVFVHGAESSHISWALLLRELSCTNRTIAIDLSGHGESDDLNGDMSIDRGYSSEIAALIEHLRLTDFILVGHSMGGGAAMSYCLDAQSILPKAPVPVDTSPVLVFSKLAPGFVREAIEDRLSLFKNQSYEDYTESHRLKELENRIRRANPGVLQHDLSVCNRFNIADRVKDIRIPTLVLVGEHDDIIPPVVAEALKNELPQADIAIAREAHHEPMTEQPEEFNRLLRKFIAWIEGKH